MISFEQFQLDNGLRVIHYHDPNSSICVLNTLYNVGARDEDQKKTGFAHLFEHLMFGGSQHIPDFDAALQRAGGTNNAFTSNDITNYYTTVPLCNVETAFWLESDRMLQLDFSQRSLDVQKKVVIEEFKQRYLNQPYGDVWHHIRSAAFKQHPYAWPTIGKEIKHVEDAQLDDVKSFFRRFYNPSNAILCIAGGLRLEPAKKLAEKWFAGIPAGPINTNQYNQEPAQTNLRRVVHFDKVPKPKLMMSFKMCDRLSPQYYPTDVLSDLLGYTDSSYLVSELVNEKQAFTSLSAYILGSLDAGLLTVSGTPSDGLSIEEAEKMVWDCIEEFKKNAITEKGIQRVVSKIKTSLVFSDLSVLEIAMNLCYYENLGNIDEVNKVLGKYNAVTTHDVAAIANTVLTKEQCTILHYNSAV